jgi:small subunit ribosomal protein S8
MYSDPLADMLTRIRNAIQVYKPDLLVPASHFKEEVARLLAQEGFLAGVERVEVEGKPYLRLRLRYGPRREKVIQHIRRISRPGRRVYASADRIPVVRRGLGVVIVSTSQGLMVDREARRRHIGGELICEVW